MRKNSSYDVVVVGGGVAGVAAAIGASQAGAKTILLERSPYFGGEGTHAGVNSLGGFYTRGEEPILVTGGVGTMVREELARLGHPSDTVISQAGNHVLTFDPEYMKLALDRVMRQSESDFLLHCQVIGATSRDGILTGVECVDDEGRFFLEGGSFVDTSGNSLLAHLTGASVFIGDEDGKRQVATMAMRISGVSPDVEVTRQSVTNAVQLGKKAGIPHLAKETGGIMRRGREDIVVLLIPSFSHTDLGCQVLTEIELSAREQARYYVTALQRFHPGMERIHLIETGPSIGIREGRRTVGEEVLTGEDVWGLKKIEKAAARGAWSPEIHRSTQVLDSYEKLPDGGWFHIPVGALKARDICNLWCGGRTISADFIAYAAIRVMGCGFATGHAAGVAAALSKENEVFSVACMQRELLRQGAII
ncbi:FAD-dependent oxidoreductase [Hominifimenecus sp. rT4P-3]|uniref:FAD-dependent oxidoreductase n=1 Tax=Hominifimenecus sp. rT4P-3 TaxID=3242979 RepID=UPI003DA36FA3